MTSSERSDEVDIINIGRRLAPWHEILHEPSLFYHVIKVLDSTESYKGMNSVSKLR